MCGIVGIVKFNTDGVRKEQLKSMSDAIVHRGPDGEGHWINDSCNVGFGHRRLSIIDLSEGGHQPMHYLGRYSITFNGEIYNYLELKKELITKGYNFQSESDTEVLLALFADKGQNMLDDLDGMFSFAIWDNIANEVFCARDRFGEKPFFYFKDENQFVFGSEMKTLWGYGIPKKVKEDRLQHYISSGEIQKPSHSDSSFYHGINQLDAAHCITLKLNGDFSIRKYWSLDAVETNNSITFEEAKKEYYRLFEESVKRRLRSDVAVGSSLSGGLDSSSIVCMIDKIKSEGQIQKVFSARFKNFDRDEGKHIEEVVSHCDAIESFYTWPSEGNIVDIMEKAVYHQEEPFGSSSILAQWKVMELAKENNVTVLMDGQGADEFLAGYLPEYKIYLNQLYVSNKKRYESEYKAYMSSFGKASPVAHLKESESLRMKLGRIKRNLLKQPFEQPTLKNSLKTLLASSGLKELLRYSDRNSMAHSREVRLPFLSHHLVEFAFSLPDEFIINDGWTKYIHRKALEPILPNSICWRKDKIGYESPQNTWMNNQEVKDRVNEQKLKFGITKDLKTVTTNYSSMDWRLFMSSYC